jgi:hypothetical protein
MPDSCVGTSYLLRSIDGGGGGDSRDLARWGRGGATRHGVLACGMSFQWCCSFASCHRATEGSAACRQRGAPYVCGKRSKPQPVAHRVLHDDDARRRHVGLAMKTRPFWWYLAHQIARQRVAYPPVSEPTWGATRALPDRSTSMDGSTTAGPTSMVHNIVRVNRVPTFLCLPTACQVELLKRAEVLAPSGRPVDAVSSDGLPLLLLHTLVAPSYSTAVKHATEFHVAKCT